MILDDLSRATLYEPLHPGFAAAFAFLRRPDLATVPSGKHEIVGDRVYAIVDRGEGRNGVSPLEAHRRYIDVQYVIVGDEKMGWRPVEGLNASCDYDPSRDIQFFHDEPAFWFGVRPAEFAIFFPADAHAPLAGRGPIHKAVVKVAVDER